jgi:hypothetical protein
MTDMCAASLFGLSDESSRQTEYPQCYVADAKSCHGIATLLGRFKQPCLEVHDSAANTQSSFTSSPARRLTRSVAEHPEGERRWGAFSPK